MEEKDQLLKTNEKNIKLIKDQKTLLNHFQTENNKLRSQIKQTYNIPTCRCNYSKADFNIKLILKYQHDYLRLSKN